MDGGDRLEGHLSRGVIISAGCSNQQKQRYPNPRRTQIGVAKRSQEDAKSICSRLLSTVNIALIMRKSKVGNPRKWRAERMDPAAALARPVL